MSPEIAPALSIVIPAYNEEQRLLGSLDEVASFTASYPGGAETIIVDDGSRDRTSGIACDFAARHSRVKVLVNKTNRGKGYSVRRGFLEARGDVAHPLEHSRESREGRIQFRPLWAEIASSGP